MEILAKKLKTGEKLGKNLKIWRFMLQFPVDLMILLQKPGDFIKKIIFWGFGDLKLKKLEIWGFSPTPPPPHKVSATQG